jgi:sec-independent protein translocase protein TatB
MFNLGAGEIAVIMIVALLLLGPDKLPELARGIGKLVREFRRQTDDVRGLVEREFYKMDQEVFSEEQAQAKRIEPPTPAEPVPPATASPEGELTPPTYPSVFPPPEGVVAAKPASAAPLGLEPPAPAPPAEPATATASASEPAAPARPEGEPASHG